MAAEEKQIYDGWVFSEQSVYVDNQVFHFWLQDRGQELVARYEDTYLVIDRYDCEQEDYIKICYTEREFDVREEENKAKVVIYSLRPDITITRTIDKKSFLVGEEATITVELTNEGIKTASDARYVERFPSFIEITDSDGVEVNGSTVIWEGKIKEDETEELEYTIKSSREIDQRIKARFDYFDGSTNKIEYSKTLRLLVEHFLDIDPILDEGVEVGEETNLTLNITNNHDSDIKVNSLRIDIPESLEVTKSPYSAERTGNSFTWDGNVKDGENIELEFRFNTKRVGINTIFINANISYDSKTEMISKQASLVVGNSGIFINTNLEDGDIFEAGYENRLKIWVQNPNEHITLANVNLVFDTDLIQIDPIYINKLDTTDLKEVVNVVFAAPNVSTATSYPFKIRASYNTPYGDMFTNELEIKNLKVEPIKPLSVTHSFSKSKAEEGDEVRLTVKVKNNRNIDITPAYIYDQSSPLLLKEGISSSVISVDAKDTVDAYSYLITAPKVSNQTRFPIITMIDYEVDNINYSDTKTSYLAVSPKDIKIRASKSIEKEDKYFAGQILELDYTLKNSEDESVRDIIIYFPKQKEFDVIGKEFYLFEGLDPDEEVKLNDIGRIRIKTNGSLRIEEGSIDYKNEDGRLFSVEDNRISLKANTSYLQGPMMWVEKSAPAEVEKGKKFDVELVVRNLGDATADVVLTDSGLEKSFRLAPGKEMQFSYETSIEESMELGHAKARYHYLATPFYAYSDSPEVKVVGEAVEKPKPVEEEEESVEEVVEDIKKQSPKGFFSRLWEVLIRWFGG